MSAKWCVGTSGFAYAAWKGSFYPAKISAPKMLPFYAGQLNAVEINSTFYRMPKAETLEKWRGQVPPGFTFVLKASQQITHHRRLKEAEEPLQYFLKIAQTLANQRGPTLVQLPPHLKRDLPRLQDFLAALPQGERVAVEFRHASWFDDSVFALLQSAGAAMCVTDVGDNDDDGALASPKQSTAPWGYARLRRTAYGEKDMHAWATWFGAQGWSHGYVFFKHEDGGLGPAWARQLHATLSK